MKLRESFPDSKNVYNLSFCLKKLEKRQKTKQKKLITNKKR